MDFPRGFNWIGDLQFEEPENEPEPEPEVRPRGWRPIDSVRTRLFDIF